MQERFKNWKPPMFDEQGWAHERLNSFDIFIGEVCLKGKKYGWRCQNHENLELGKNVDVGCFTYINAKHGVKIGDNVQIGAHCAIYSDNTENETQGKVVVGENSLIGSYTLILPNSNIPPGSKIKARSIIK